MKYYYCAFESIFDHIFDSQVLIFLEKINQELQKKDKSVTFINFCSIGDIFKKEYLHKKKSIRTLLGSKCFFSVKFPYLKRFPAFFKLMLFLNAIKSLLEL